MKKSRVFTALIIMIFFLQTGITNLFAGELVRKAQESLVGMGVDPGPVDGLWGPLTQGAVKKFQENQGLPVSGRLDDETKKHLFSFTHEILSTEKTAPETQETTQPAVSAVAEEKNAPVAGEEPVKKVSPKQTLKAPDSVEAKPASPPGPKVKETSAVKKASGPCPQPRKTKSAPASIAKLDKTGGANSDRGKKIYSKTAKPMACKMCHGDKGDGKGKLGAALKPRPRNFTCAETMKKVSPGQMFWIIKNGSPGTAMVAHKKSLQDKEIWDVVKYIRSTFLNETPAGEKTASKSIPEETSAPASSKSAPEVAAQASVAPSPARQLPKGFKVTGKYAEGTVSNGGSISGVVQFSGKVPAPIMEDLSKGKNVEFCSTHPDAKGTVRPRVKVAVVNGNLRDAVVFIQNIKTGKAWPTAINNFDFRTCDIFPKVSVIRKTPRGMKTGLLTITNQDPDILHNPHGYSIAGASRKTLFNKPLPSKGDVADVTRSFKRFKPSKDKHFFLQCDQHNFMEADARVVWNPYYSLSGADGAFKIDRIPAGKYWVTAWHPYIGEVSREVTVTGGADVRSDFELVSK